MLSLRAGRLFDGLASVPEPIVNLENGSIVSVGRALRGAEVVDLGDVTLLPGLIDTHQHLCFDGNGTLEEQVAGISDDDLRRRARGHAERALRAGITTVRDLGDRNFVTLGLRDDPDLPTILVSGPPLTADGGHCWFLGGCCSDASALVDAVHERKRRGCDVVKIMVTGGALTPTFPMWESQFGAADVAAVVVAAHAMGLPVAAHCHGIEGTSYAIAAGVDTIEHCTFMSSRARSEPDGDLLRRIAIEGVAVSATFGRVPDIPPPPIVEENLPTIVELMGSPVRNGGTLIVGTDAGITPGKPHDVLPFAVRELGHVGLTGDEILRTLSSTAATVCRVGDRKGRLAPGYDADILAVAGDPCERPQCLRDVCGVWRGGRRLVG